MVCRTSSGTAREKMTEGNYGPTPESLNGLDGDCTIEKKNISDALKIEWL